MDEQLYLMAVGLSLAEKVTKSIANLQHYEREALKHDPVDGYWLCDSFGKDSCVIRHLAKVAGVAHKCHHNLTTLDPPELIHFGREHHPETIIHRPERPLLKQMLEPGTARPPTRLTRWCCAKYKESKGSGVLVFGVRAAESVTRKANWSTWQKHRGRKEETWILNPILYWSDEDVWRYIRNNDLPYCSLYDEGFKRLGCIGCPMARKGRIEQFKRWPKYERAWQKGFENLWNKYHGTLTQHGKVRAIDRMGFEGWEDYWRWWMSGESSGPFDDGCQMGLF